MAMPQGHISKIENGRVDPKLSNVVEIARLLDYELVLIPRSSLPLCNHLLKGKQETSPKPMWVPDEEDE
jgi:DNA-binding XRE family transcriptional regulator